jgi:2OG-Fe(II) oxygenase superfamily
MVDHFVWHSYDLRSGLPSGWQEEILAVAKSKAYTKVIKPLSVTSRELSHDIDIPIHLVDGKVVVKDLPWVQDLYHGMFREMAQQLVTEPLTVAADTDHGARLQIQRGADERYECHVDTCPITGLFYVTDHPPGAGGELVISNRGDIYGREEVERDATRIHPVAGQVVFFDGRRRTHFVAPLVDPTVIRVVVPMVFFSPSCSEGMRPTDLDRHLGLKQ